MAAAAEAKAETSKPNTEAPAEKSFNPLILLAHVTIGVVWVGSQLFLIPYVIHLLLLVTAILYIACHYSLALREEPPVEMNPDGTVKDANPGKVQAGETLRKEDAMQFPLLGSASLFSLYIAFKYFDKEIVNLLIGLYFCAVGCAALFASLNPCFPKFGFRVEVDKKINHPLPAFLMESPLHIDIKLRFSDLLVLLGCMVFCGFYFQTKHWAMNNVLGICFCLQGIQRFSLGTYKIGAILLIGLFFYDIFWVFGTEVMVSVAKNLDGPIKILFPRQRNEETGKLEMSLLGLGDIVIPGFFLALLLRFDAYMAEVPTSHTDVHAQFPKPYFHSALVAYVLGLGTTLYVMIAFEAAQPALLYLVPACLGSSWICAMVRKETADLLEYSEEDEEDDKTKESDTKETDAAKADKKND